MNVTREVILDLLPVYLSGEASPATRALVEEYVKQDPELAQRIRLQSAEEFARSAPPALAPELELRSLRRTRGLLRWQRLLFGFGIGFIATGFSARLSFKGGRLTDVYFLPRDNPAGALLYLALGLACWIAYFLMRRRLRTTAP